MVRISEGAVNNYLIPGVFLVIIGLICIVVGLGVPGAALICGILFLVIAIVLFSATSGLEINQVTRQYRKYGKFGPVVLGDWKSIPECLEIRIQIHVETASRTSGGAVPLPSHKTKALTYDVITIDTLNEEKIVYGFLKYRDAKEAGRILADVMGVSLHNKVAEKLARNRSRRR